MASRRIMKTAKKAPKRVQVNLYEAKTQLSSLVERAANGEEIVIAKANKPMAKLVPILAYVDLKKPERLPFGQNLLGIEFLSDDWEADIPSEWFEDPEGDKLLHPESAK
jgi:prevent-host-death family protein